MSTIVFQQPTGLGNGAFTYQDLLNVEHEFPGSIPGAYFSQQPTDAIVCTQSVSDARVQWCAPKAEPYVLQPFTGNGIYSVPPYKPPTTPVVVVPPPPPPPVTTATPEPNSAYLVLLLLVCLLIAIAWREVRDRGDL